MAAANAPARIVFMGTPQFAATILEALLDARTPQGSPRYEVVAAFCQPDRRAGRGRKLMAPAVKVAAERAGVAVHQPTRLKDGTALALLQQLRPDVVVVAAYGRILPAALLEVAPRGCVNVHASLLPRWRGASPIARSILHGDAETGISIMAMDVGCDTGGVYAQAALAIDATDTTETLTPKVAKLGAETLLAALPGILNGSQRAHAQPTDGMTHAPLFVKSDGALDFAEDATTLARKVRALTPWPSAFMAYLGARVIVLGAHPAPGDDTAYSGRHGEILQADAEGLRVACGRGSLWLTRVKPAGKEEMHVGRWIAGRGPQKGATLEKVTENA